MHSRLIRRLHLALIAVLFLSACGGHAPSPPVPPPATILPSATVGKTYRYTLGAAPSSFSASGVPLGLQVVSQGGSLIISGVPEKPGVFTFSINQTAASLQVKQ